MIKLNPNERLLIESGVNHYRIVGPGLVLLAPWQRARTRLYIGPQGQSVHVEAARTGEDIPVDLTVQVLYRVAPHLFNDDLLPRLPAFNEGGWQNIVQWRTEAVLRPLLAGYTWRGLQREEVQQRLERQLTMTLADRLEKVALQVFSVALVRTELNVDLQRTIIRAERDGIEAHGRAVVLKEYFETFGHSLPEAMPYIIQWELLNLMHKNGHAQLLMTGAGLAPNAAFPEAAQPVFQMKLPLPQQEYKEQVDH